MRRASTAESCGGGGEGARGLESEEKRVGERRSSHREREIGREPESAGRRAGGGVQLIRVDGRCVRFRPSLLLLIRMAEGGRSGNDFKRKSRICYRWVALYNLLCSALPLWFPLSAVYAVHVSHCRKIPNRINVSTAPSISICLSLPGHTLPFNYLLTPLITKHLFINSTIFLKG